MDVSFSQENGGRIMALHLARCKAGIRIDVKAAPLVEDFFRQWALGMAPESLGNYGRQWSPTDPTKRLNVYPLHSERIEQERYSLWHPGRGLSFDGRTNISFLRLEGISNPDGVSFTVEEVMSKSELDNLADRIKLGCGWFYAEYIKDTRYDVVLDARPRL